jgi:hypothetical protein
LQIDGTQSAGFVSCSPYAHSFDCLESVHRGIEAQKLTAHMENIGYRQTALINYPLPNGKTLTEIDYYREN